MLTNRLQDPSLIKERSSHPPDQDPLVTQHSHLINLLNLPILPILLPTSQGLPSCFSSVFLLTVMMGRRAKCIDGINPTIYYYKNSHSHMIKSHDWLVQLTPTNRKEEVT